MSTGKAGCPNPCDITTLAVLCPTPGKLSRDSKFSGTSELNLFTIIFDSFEILEDFWGAKPHDLIIFSIYEVGIFIILSGVFPSLNNPGVT